MVQQKVYQDLRPFHSNFMPLKKGESSVGLLLIQCNLRTTTQSFGPEF